MSQDAQVPNATERDALHAALKVLSTAQDVGDQVAGLGDLARRLTGAQRWLVARADFESGELQVRSAEGVKTHLLDTGILGSVVAAREGENLASARRHGAWDAAVDGPDGPFLAAPLLDPDGRALGALAVAGCAAGGFDAAAVQTLAALAAQAAVALRLEVLLQRDHERERMAGDMRLARKLQKNLLPQAPPQIPGWRLAAWQRPCEETSGDYHDFLPLEGNGLDLVVGDVSGHGLGAALLMITARAALRAMHARIGRVEQVLASLNGLLGDDLTNETFMTMLVCRLGGDGSVRYAAAGHEPPLVYRAATHRFDDLPSGGMLLGVLPDSSYAVFAPPPLAPGDVLVAFTDGINEADDAAGEQWGHERLRACIARNAALGAELLAAAILDEVSQHLGDRPPRDDITLVIAQRCDEETSPV